MASVDLDAKLAELRESYVSTLGEQLSRFRACVARLESAREPDEALRERALLRDIAHRTSGTAALYGMAALSQWGRGAERLCLQGSIADLHEVLAALQRVLDGVGE